MKKPPSHPWKEGAEYLNRLSKAALIDLVLDAYDLASSEHRYAPRLANYCAPRLRARDDSVPNVKGQA